MKSNSRHFAVDALRGLIMVLMALDHANNFVSRLHPRPEMWSGPMQVYGGDVLWFVTRFVTHFCAPGFFLLMGAGMMLFAESRREAGWSEWRITGFFLLRGALLIVLQQLVENPAWNIGSEGGFGGLTYIGVLYALGVAMMVSALLLRLPSWGLLLVALAALAATALLLPAAGTPNAGYSTFQRLLLVPGPGESVYVLYPAIPWLAPTALGLLLGRMLRADRERAYRIALFTGLVFIAGFFVLRILGGFGNIRPIEGEGWIPFLNLVKYPPALVYLLLTLGVNLVLLYLFSRIPAAAQRFFLPLVVFGQSPLFFYVVHLYLYGLLGLPFAPRGTSLGTMYLLWLVGLAILFPLCWLYGRFKQSRPITSLWRLF